MNTFKYSSPSTQPSSITLDTLVQEASQKTSHPYLKRKVTHRKTFAKLQNQDSLLRWTKDQLRSESLRIYQDSHPRLHVSSLNTKGTYGNPTNTDNATRFDKAELFDFFDLKPQKTSTQMGRVRYTSPSLETSSSSDMYGISMKQGSTQTLIDSGMVSTDPSIASTYPTYSLSLKGASFPIYSHIVPKV